MEAERFIAEPKETDSADKVYLAIKQLKSANFFNESLEKRQELVRYALETLKDSFAESGGSYHQDINEVYEIAQGNSLIVRRHDLEKLVEAITNHTDLEISPDPNVGEAYPNCAEWKYDLGPRGLQNALLEGHAQLGGLVTVAGFKKGGSLEIKSVNTENISGLDRDLVRFVRGRVHPEEIEFIVLRIPATLLPQGELTPFEQKMLEREVKKPKERQKIIQVFRGFTFNEFEQKYREKLVT